MCSRKYIMSCSEINTIYTHFQMKDVTPFKQTNELIVEAFIQTFAVVYAYLTSHWVITYVYMHDSTAV